MKPTFRLRYLIGLSSISIWLVISLTGCATTPRPDELVDVERMIPGVVLDIRYATTNNFTGQRLYYYTGLWIAESEFNKDSKTFPAKPECIDRIYIFFNLRIVGPFVL